MGEETETDHTVYVSSSMTKAEMYKHLLAANDAIRKLESALKAERQALLENVEGNEREEC